MSLPSWNLRFLFLELKWKWSENHLFGIWISWSSKWPCHPGLTDRLQGLRSRPLSKPKKTAGLVTDKVESWWYFNPRPEEVVQSMFLGAVYSSRGYHDVSLGAPYTFQLSAHLESYYVILGFPVKDMEDTWSVAFSSRFQPLHCHKLKWSDWWPLVYPELLNGEHANACHTHESIESNHALFPVPGQGLLEWLVRLFNFPEGPFPLLVYNKYNEMK